MQLPDWDPRTQEAFEEERGASHNVSLSSASNSRSRHNYSYLNVPLLIEYLPNADFQIWLQRISKAIVLCMVSCIALIIVSQCFPFFRDEILYRFFRYLLIPVKPLLFVKAGAGLSGVVNVLTFISQIVNVVVFPIVAYTAVKAGSLSEYLYLKGNELVFLKQINTNLQSTEKIETVHIDKKYFQILRRVPLNQVSDIYVERPTGKKSHGDYVLNLTTPGRTEKIRWGDILNPEDRNMVLERLEKCFPASLDLTILEPFRRISQKQSYTELWLRELSGAPKRDKLTPLLEGALLDNGNYTILRKVGVGGQATVYLASMTKDTEESQVVLKEFVLPVYPDLRVRKRAAERFQAEASMLGRLQHPQIAQFLSLFVEDHRAYLVLEHVDGRSLKDLVASEGKLPEAEVLSLAIQIAEILAYLHGQSPAVIHRDLTPDNIMLGADGKAKLIDFSVAQELSSGVTGSVVGKPNYISPEQFRGKPTTQSDIYSFGATLYYLLVGSDPPPITVLHPKSEIPGISDLLDAVIARATQLDTTKRYESAAALLEDLHRANERRTT